MTRFYLITGFLGAGKTTFLRQILEGFAGERVSVIVNDFGREQVDAALLSRQGVVLEEINNGSIFCACRAEQFREALEHVLDREPDVVFTEASGLADPTHLNAVLQRQEAGRLSLAGTVCLVDAVRFHKVRNTARVVRQQLAAADGIVLNKIDLAPPEQRAAIRAELELLCPDIPVIETTYSRVPGQWFRALRPAPLREGGSAPPHRRDITLQKLTLHLEDTMTLPRLRAFLEAVAGDTYRIKGFAALEGALTRIDCVGELICVSPWDGAVRDLGRVTVLYGNGLPARRTIQAALARDPIGVLE